MLKLLVRATLLTAALALSLTPVAAHATRPASFGQERGQVDLASTRQT